MSRRRSALRSEADVALAVAVKGYVERYGVDSPVVAEILREPYRVGWSYVLIGEVVGISAAKARRMRMADLRARGLLA